jgi:hypothetical protein
MEFRKATAGNSREIASSDLHPVILPDPGEVAIPTRSVVGLDLYYSRLMSVGADQCFGARAGGGFVPEEKYEF